METKEYNKELKYKIRGFDDTQCTCDVCGKQELKGTYIMEDLSTGLTFRAGSTCGAKMAGWTTKELIERHKSWEKEKLDNAKKEYRNTLEYIAYNQALDFLQNESNDLEKKFMNCSNEVEKEVLRKSERTFESRLQYLEPYRKAAENAKNIIIAKYNLNANQYIY